MVQSNKHAAGRPKDMEKREMILSGASDLFLELGFAQTSMDAVARVAAVSKQTVYSHFANKDELFEACILNTCQAYQLDSIDAIEVSAPEGLEEQLQIIATQFVALLHDPRVIAMYAVVIAESKNNPSVAKSFYKAGPDRALNTVMACLAKTYPDLDTRLLRELAVDFYNLLKADYHFRSILSMPFSLSAEEQGLFVTKVVHKFLSLLPEINNKG